MLVNLAFADTTHAVGTSGSPFAGLWVFVVFFVIMYFFIIRPQRQQMKKREEMLNAIRRGDNIITGGGIVGKVTKVHDNSDELSVEIAPNLEVRVLRSTISNIRVKGEPIRNEVASEKPKKKSAAKPANEKKNAVSEESIAETIEEEKK